MLLLRGPDGIGKTTLLERMRRLLRAASRVIDIPWHMAVGADLALRHSAPA